MSNQDIKTSGGAAQPPPPVDFTTELFNRLTSMKFALFILLVIALACIAGTLFPQGYEVSQYLQKNPDATRRMELLGNLGLTHVFSCWWFLAFLSILGANLTFCVVKRLGLLKTARGPALTRLLGTMSIHISMLIIFVGGTMRGVLAEKGTIAFNTGESVNSFAVENGEQKLPFTVKLLKFEVERYKSEDADSENDGAPIVERLNVEWPEKKIATSFTVEPNVEYVVSPKGEEADSNSNFRVSVIRRVTDFAIDLNTRQVSSKSDEMNNPAIQVKVTGGIVNTEKWLFAAYPDFDMHSGGTNAAAVIPFKMSYNVSVRHMRATGRIKSFKSSVQIIENGTVQKEKTIEVNSPLHYGGYSLFQTGYNENDLNWTSLQVVRDPSVPVVYAGFILMIAGLLITTYRGLTAQGKR